MKVTFLLKDLQSNGGGNRIIAQHAQFLINSGHAVKLIGLPPARLSLRDRARAVRQGKIVHALEGTRGNKVTLSNHYEPIKPHIKVLNKHRSIQSTDVGNADIVIATWWETAEWMGRFSDGTAKLLHFVQDYEVFENMPKDRVLAVYDKKYPSIVVSNWIKEKLETLHNNQDLHVVNNTVDASFFCTEKQPRHTLKVGTLLAAAERKRCDLALKVMHKVRSERPDFHFLAFGQSKFHFELPDWIEFVENPEQQSIPDIYSDCDLWLLTSRSEGFGLPILEAMAAGTPVLATRAGIAPDVLDGKNGQIVPDDVDEIATIIWELASAPDLLAEMSANARATAEQFCKVSSSESFERVLVQILAEETPLPAHQINR